MELEDEHYSRGDVKREIAEFSRGRWAAVYCSDAGGGKPTFRRYTAEGRPLTVSTPGEVWSLYEKLRELHPRAFYATALKYRRLSSRYDLLNPENPHACTPTWDIDNEPSMWEATLRAAELILDELRLHGVSESVYLKWSGRGCHVHIHEGAVSQELLHRVGALNASYAVVEYVCLKVAGRVAELAVRSGASTLKVENRIDPQRLFTCPLSLHRRLDAVCVCFKPEELHEFHPDWTKPHTFRHNPEWRRYVQGEADELVRRAYEAVGGYPRPYRPRRRKHPPLDRQILRWLRSSRYSA